MTTSVLFRGTLRDSFEAKLLLKKNNINFVEMFSIEDAQPPVLWFEDSLYSLKGIEEITLFFESKKKIKEFSKLQVIKSNR